MSAEKTESPLAALCAALEATIGANHDTPTFPEKAAHEGRAAINRGFAREADYQLAAEVSR